MRFMCVRETSVEWYTPREIFEALKLEFDLDPCSPGADVVPWIPVRRHIVRPRNGLFEPWEGRVWLNPPYGGETVRWIQRLAGHGDGVALVSARMDTRWFHEWASTADVICFVRGRLNFVPERHAAEYAAGLWVPGGENCTSDVGSMLLAWGADNAAAVSASGLGSCCTISAPVRRVRSLQLI